MKIYISGKISGTDDYKERFQEAADYIRNIGHEPINPCDLDAILNPKTTTWDQYMLADLGLLRCCDAIYFPPGAEESRGSRIEKSEAYRLGLIIFEKLEQIP